MVDHFLPAVISTADHTRHGDKSSGYAVQFHEEFCCVYWELYDIETDKYRLIDWILRNQNPRIPDIYGCQHNGTECYKNKYYCQGCYKYHLYLPNSL